MSKVVINGFDIITNVDLSAQPAPEVGICADWDLLVNKHSKSRMVFYPNGTDILPGSDPDGYYFYELWEPNWYGFYTEPSNKVPGRTVFTTEEYITSAGIRVRSQDLTSPYDYIIQGTVPDAICIYLEFPQGLGANGYGGNISASIGHTIYEPRDHQTEITVTKKQYDESESKVFRFRYEFSDYQKDRMNQGESVQTFHISSYEYTVVRIHELKAIRDGEIIDYQYIEDVPS